MGMNKTDAWVAGSLLIRKAARAAATNASEPVSRPIASLPPPLSRWLIVTIASTTSGGKIGNGGQQRTNICCFVAVGCTQISRERIDYDKSDIADLCELRFESHQIARKTEAPHCAGSWTAVSTWTRSISAPAASRRGLIVSATSSSADSISTLPFGARPSPAGQRPPRSYRRGLICSKLAFAEAEDDRPPS